MRSHDSERFPAAMPDDEWLDIVGPKGWIVCSHDAKWHLPADFAALRAIKQHRIGCFYLWGAQLPIFYKAKALLRNYDKIARVCQDEPKPYIYRVTPGNRLVKVL